MSLRWRFLISSFFLAFRGSLGKRPGIEFAKGNPATRNARRQTRLRVPRRICARGFAGNFLTLQSEGAGNTGCPLPPRSRVQQCTKKRTRAYRFSGGNPAFPAQWFTAYIALSPVSRAFLPPSPLRSLLLRNLTPPSGRQAHTSSPSASSAFVKGAIRVHRVPPRVCDDRETPLFRDGMANHIA